MSKFLQKITATGIHGRFNYECNFQEGVNVVYGKNGTGKTTLIHILANLLNADYARFAALVFNTIKVEMSDGTIINLECERTKDSHGSSLVQICLNKKPLFQNLKTSYLSSISERETLHLSILFSTSFSFSI